MKQLVTRRTGKIAWLSIVALILLSALAWWLLRPPSAPTDKVALRLLVVSAAEDDTALAATTDLLERLGTPYDVLNAADTPLTDATLIAPDGTGRYQGVLLTEANLAYSDGTTWKSAFSPEEWGRLWRYERDYGVRQAAFYARPESAPEDYGLRLAETKDLQEQALLTSLTQRGQAVFSYLQPDVEVPVRYSRAYLAEVEEDGAEPLLQDAGGRVLAALSTSEDGRERLALTVAQGPYLLHTQLLGYGVVNWLTRGLFLGERHTFLQVDVDDWFQHSYRWNTRTLTAGPETFRLSAQDALAAKAQQDALRSRHPLADDFRLAVAFVGLQAELDAEASCDADAPSPDPLTSGTRCLSDDFYWLNHTFTEQIQDETSYEAVLEDIQKNNEVAERLGLTPYSGSSLLTSGHSGLGFYPVETPVDRGLEASNPALIRAAKDAGVRYIGGNYTVPSQVAACGTCGIIHPLEPSLLVVPRYPTNVFVSLTTPEEAVSAYNSVYGPGGTSPTWAEPLTYEEYLDKDTDFALLHLLAFSPYPHFFHQANLHEYAPGRSLVFDWLGMLVRKYESFYTLPLVSLPWEELGEHIAARTHMREMGVEALWDRNKNTLRLSAEQAGLVFLTGADVGRRSETYGGEVISSLRLRANRTKTVKLN